MKRQREMAYGSASLKVSGVYMPGSDIPMEEYEQRKEVSSAVSNPDLLNHVSHLNQDGTSAGGETFVAATEEVTEMPTERLTITPGTIPLLFAVL